jgi:SPP1 family predicted phage head-tail adaptor
MNAGNFNRLITIETLTAGVDGAGGTFDPSWVQAGQFWAQVEPMEARRYMVYTQIVEGRGYIITTHFMTDYLGLAQNSRLVMENGKRITIHSVRNVKEKNQYLEIICDDGD